jgi:hypothetical protein
MEVLMFRPTIVRALLTTLLLVSGCEHPPLTPSAQPALNQAPADGNGNKTVLSFNLEVPITCTGGETLVANFVGWTQIRLFQQPSNRNVELDVFHAAVTVANAADETFVFHDVGPDRYYLDSGNLIVTVTGRASASGVIGHVVFNLVTGEPELVAGNEFGTLADLACDALT